MSEAETRSNLVRNDIRMVLAILRRRRDGALTVNRLLLVYPWCPLPQATHPACLQIWHKFSATIASPTGSNGFVPRH